MVKVGMLKRFQRKRHAGFEKILNGPKLAPYQ